MWVLFALHLLWRAENTFRNPSLALAHWLLVWCSIKWLVWNKPGVGGKGSRELSRQADIKLLIECTGKKRQWLFFWNVRRGPEFASLLEDQEAPTRESGRHPKRWDKRSNVSGKRRTSEPAVRASSLTRKIGYEYPLKSESTCKDYWLNTFQIDWHQLSIYYDHSRMRLGEVKRPAQRYKAIKRVKIRTQVCELKLCVRMKSDLAQLSPVQMITATLLEQTAYE